MKWSESDTSVLEREHRIKLHFFESKREERLRAEWDQLLIHSEAPALAEVPNGLIPQFSKAVISGSKELNCVFDANNRPVVASARLRSADSPGEDDTMPAPAAFENVVHDDRAAYLLGPQARHYGHFLLETFCRAWAWNGSRHEVAIILVPPIRDFARAFCAFLPGLAERIEVVQANTRFRHVTAPSAAFAISREAHVEFKRMCDRITDRALPSGQAVVDQPVYLSRARLKAKNSRRALIGEVRLERFLESEGFRVVHPETLTIAEQIAIVNRHKWIVAPMGSACHTRLFSRNRNNLVMLTSDKVHPNYVLCDLLCGGSAHYANVFRSPLHGRGVPPALKPVVVDSDRLLGLLKDFGLVRTTAQFDGAPADFTDETERSSADFAAEIESSIKTAKWRAQRRAKRKERNARKADES